MVWSMVPLEEANFSNIIYCTVYLKLLQMFKLLGSAYSCKGSKSSHSKNVLPSLVKRDLFWKKGFAPKEQAFFSRAQFIGQPTGSPKSCPFQKNNRKHNQAYPFSLIFLCNPNIYKDNSKTFTYNSKFSLNLSIVANPNIFGKPDRLREVSKLMILTSCDPLYITQYINMWLS